MAIPSNLSFVVISLIPVSHDCTEKLYYEKIVWRQFELAFFGAPTSVGALFIPITICKGVINMENKKLVRFLLTFFLGWIGSIIINHTELKPEGYTSRTLAYIFLTMITFGIYGLVASICNLTFDPANGKVIGYKKD